MWTLTRQLLLLVASLAGAVACESLAQSAGQDQRVTVARPTESKANANTLSLLQSLFERADSIEFRFVPFNRLEIRGYEPNPDLMPYAYVFRCGSLCPTYGRRLLTRLSTARQADGECPWFTAALIFSDSRQERHLARMLVDSTGRCLQIDGRLYVLESNASLAYLFEASNKVFEF